MIGNILLVAIVVILGAVVSVYALGVASDVGSPAPQVVFEFNPDYATGDITIRKQGGDTLDGDQVKFSGAALEKTSYGGITEWAGKDVKIGDSASVNVVPGETLKLLWRSPNGGNSAILAEYDVPNDVGPTASVGSVNTDWNTYIKGELIIKNIQFSRVENDRVYIVVQDESTGGTATSETYFSTSGGDLEVDLHPDSHVGHGETIIVTVYENDRKSTELAKVTALVP